MPDNAPFPSPWTEPGDGGNERQAKRDAVLTTAVRFFNTRGFHATSLEDVAVALKVTKPTIYHYFANKDEILFECTRRGLDRLGTSLREIERVGSGAERLSALLNVYALIMLDDFGICVARTSDHLLSDESRTRFRALKREIDGLLRRAVEEGCADGSLDVPDARIATFTAASALNGLCNWFDPAGPMTREEIAAIATQTLMRGMIPRKEG